MEIGKEADQPVEYPEPVAPGQQPVQEPSPVIEPAREPAHALFGGKPLTEIQAEIMDEITEKYRNG